jgi:hypothetical protein
MTWSSRLHPRGHGPLKGGVHVDAVVEPVPVEPPEGRAEYERRQRELSEYARVLRDRLVEVVAVTASADGRPVPPS